jgi:hypothetical protein
MAWWSSISSAKLLFVVVVDDAFSVAESAYRGAARRLEHGLYESFPWAGFNIEVHACSGERLIPTAPLLEWNSFLPDDLAVQWMSSSDMAMDPDATTHPAHADTAPILAADSLAPRPSDFLPPMRLSPRWAPLFPAAAVAEGLLLRDKLRRVYAVMNESRAGAKRITGAFVRERTEVVTCPDSLASWDVRAARDPYQALNDAKDEFGLGGETWADLRESAAFRERASKEHQSALVVFGWAGLMWLQFDLLASRGRCGRAGCFRPAATARRGYCETHWLEASRERDRLRQQRFRERHRRR